MKKILIFFAISSMFIACKNKGKNGLATDKNLVLTDTALLRRSGLLSDTASTAIVNGTTNTSSTTTTVTTTTTNGIPVNTVAKTKSGVKKSPVKRTSTSTSPAKSTSTGNSSTETSTTAPVQQRDGGWSDAAKGTAIGAGSGAVIGAVVSKDKVKGAVIGGVVGAAGGYAIGRDRDRKSGRVARNKKQ